MAADLALWHGKTDFIRHNASDLPIEKLHSYTCEIELAKAKV